MDRFSAWHRANYGGCKAGNADILLGATALLAEIHGTIKNSIVRDKLTEIVHLVETIYASAVGSSALGTKLPAGNWLVDPLLANTVKQNVTRFLYQVGRLAHDLGGGLLSTLPSDADFRSGEIGGLLTKYFAGRQGFATEEKRKLCRHIENMTSVATLVEALHGAGSPQAQRIVMLRITSYNVCYTKLLRTGDTFSRRVWSSTKERWKPSGTTRITSYNVCYTKLLRSCRSYGTTTAPGPSPCT